MSSRPPPAHIGQPAGVPRRAPLHPGRFLERHYLKPLGITQTDTARRLGISRQRLNELIQGRRSMTPDTAIRCALAFGLPVSKWLALQAEWDSFHAWKALRHELAPARAARPAGCGLGHSVSVTGTSPPATHGLPALAG